MMWLIKCELGCDQPAVTNSSATAAPAYSDDTHSGAVESARVRSPHAGAEANDWRDPESPGRFPIPLWMG